MRASRHLFPLALAAMLVVVVASAWIRIGYSTRSCSPWPVCRYDTDIHEGTLARSPVAAARKRLDMWRAVHRTAASCVLLATLAILGFSLADRSVGRGVVLDAALLLVLAIGLAVLGMAMGGSRAPPVLLGNLLGGQLMLAFAWRLFRRQRGAPAPGRGLARIARIAAASWLVQAILGATSSAVAGLAAPIAHVVLGVPVAGMGFLTGLIAMDSGRRAEGLGLIALAPVQTVLGASAIVNGVPAPLVFAHSLGAAIGLALLAELSRRETAGIPECAGAVSSARGS